MRALALLLLLASPAEAASALCWDNEAWGQYGVFSVELQWQLTEYEDPETGLHGFIATTMEPQWSHALWQEIGVDCCTAEECCVVCEPDPLPGNLVFYMVRGDVELRVEAR